MADKQDKLVMTRQEFLDLGAKLFGTSSMRHWVFVCPVCGHEQSGAAMVEKYPEQEEYIKTSCYFSCEGRLDPKGKSFMGGKPTKKHGCDYTSGGLLTLNTLFIIDDDGREVPLFRLKGMEKLK